VADIAYVACGSSSPSHGGRLAAVVRACPAGHLRAGFACEACRGTLSIAVCLECPPGPSGTDLRPAILIPAEAFRAAPFGSVMMRLREMDTELAMAAEMPGG
jgi:hypothetical protein